MQHETWLRPTQNLLAPQAMITHTGPHASAWSLHIKGIFIYRRVAMLVRLGKSRGRGDPRHLPDFQALEQVIEDYKSVDLSLVKDGEDLPAHPSRWPGPQGAPSRRT